jgi:hypothetical protein
MTSSALRVIALEVVEPGAVPVDAMDLGHSGTRERR